VTKCGGKRTLVPLKPGGTRTPPPLIQPDIVALLADAAHLPHIMFGPQALAAK